MIKSKITFILALFSLAIGFAACNLVSIPGVEQQLSEQAQSVQKNVVASIAADNIDGNIRFFLTDAPLDDVKEVNITVTELRIKKHVEDPADEATEEPTEEITEEGATDESSDASENEAETKEADNESEEADDSEWETITFDPARVIDLKKLTEGLTDVLGDLSLPTGVYKEIRLHVTQSEVVLNDGTKETLKIPSGGSSGLKIKFKGDGVSIEEGKKYALVLDFDLEKSLIRKSDKKHSTGSDASNKGGKSGSDDEETTDETTTEEESVGESDSEESTSTESEEEEADDDSSVENESVEGSTWILKPVIRVSYLAEIDDESDTATVILTDE